jgi:hypothetical protein
MLMNKFIFYILFFFTYSIVNANEINQPKNVLFIMVDDLRPKLFVFEWAYTNNSGRKSSTMIKSTFLG